MLSLCANELAFQCFFVFSNPTNLPLLKHRAVTLNTVQSCWVPEDVFIISILLCIDINMRTHTHTHTIYSFSLNQNILSLKRILQEEHFLRVPPNSEEKNNRCHKMWNTLIKVTKSPYFLQFISMFLKTEKMRLKGGKKKLVTQFEISYITQVRKINGFAWTLSNT